MPWTDKPSGSNNSGPWGRPDNTNGRDDSRGRRGGGAPDLEELLRSGRARFGRGSGGGGSDGGQGIQPPSGRILGLAALGIVVLYFFTAIYTVNPGARGVVTTFGKFTALTDPGLNFHFPPFQSYEIVDVEQDRRVTIGGRSSRSSMLTSDLNIVDVGMDVNFRIQSDATWDPATGELPNAAKYIFNIEEPEATVQAAAEAALREVVGANEFTPIISRGRSIVTDRTAEILQQTLSNYESGIEIIRVNFGQADPPAAVVPAQRDVIDATSDAAQAVNVAQGYANQVVPRARGEARQKVLTAEAYAADVVAQSRGDAARFVSILDEYAKAPDVTRQRMYLETMEKVLGDMNKVLIDDEAGGTLPYLNLNELTRDAQRSRPRTTTPTPSGNQ